MANSVTLTFAGDTTSLDKATKAVDKDLDSVSKSLDDNAKHVEHASGKLDDLGEGLEKSTGKFRGGKDVLDGFSDSMSSFGVELPGPIGNIAMLGGGLADLADGIATSGLPLLKKLWLLMEANPLIAIAGLVIALGIGLYELYQHSETFRKAVQALWSGVKSAFSAIESAGESVFHKLEGWFDTAMAASKAFGKVVMDVAKVLFAPYRAAFNLIADAWNATVGKLSFSVPGWVPGLGGKGWDVPDLPHFANGGQINGPAIVGERGPELFVPGTAGRIIPNNQMGGSGTVYVDVTVRNEDGTVLQQLRRLARTEGGGSVQAAFGR